MEAKVENFAVHATLSLQNTGSIIVASMTLNNYIRRRSQHDDVFVEYDRNPDYISDELLPDVVTCETSQSSGRNSRMDIVRESIANSLMGE